MGSMRSFVRITTLTALICLLGPVTNAQAGSGEGQLRLLPDTVGVGGEVLFSAAKLNPGVRYLVRLTAADGGETPLGEVLIDEFGNALGREPLPELDPGLYTLGLFEGTSGPAVSAELILTAGPQVSLDPARGYGGQRVQVNVTGLVPGMVEIKVADTTVAGPFTVVKPESMREFFVPAGGVAQLPVTVENSVGERVIGSGEATFERLRTDNPDAEIVSVEMPAEPLLRGARRTVSGRLRLPDGTQPEDFQWTYVIAQRDGAMIPVNLTPFQFASAKGSAVSTLFDFTVDIVAPSLLAGFSFIDLDRDTDQHGVVYQKPQTDNGSDGDPLIDGDLSSYSAPGTFVDGGFIPLPITPDYGDEQGIEIRGRVVDATNADPNTNGINDAIVSVVAETPLIDPNDIGRNAVDLLSGGGKAPGDEVAVSRSLAALWAQNQIAAAAEQIQIQPPLATGCPVTLNNTTTNALGEYSFAFSPEVTEFLNLMRAQIIKLKEQGLIPNSVPDPALDRFIVRIAALHLKDAYGIPASLALSSFTGVRYDFERTDNGQYFLCPNFDENGNFDDDCAANGESFNPNTTVLQTSLKPAPSGITKDIAASQLAIEGLKPPTEPQSTVGEVVWDGLLTFPGEADNPSINQESLTLKLTWNSVLFGAPAPDGAAVELDGVPGDFPLLLNFGSNPCSPTGVAYTADLTGVAVLPGPITGEVSVVVGETLYRRDIRIETTPGPTWFAKADRYLQPVNINWSPEKATITAVELTKDLDVSHNFGNTLSLGQIDNDNREQGIAVTQTFIVGDSGQGLKRLAGADVNVMNEGSSALPKALYLGPETAFEAGTATGVEEAKGSASSLVGRTLTEAPDFGSGSPQTLFSAWTPLFRYVWGVPPIAAATLGADLIFGAKLLYFGYIQATSTTVDVDSLIEPSVFLVLNVFFDFSAIFGLVNASVEAAPEIGVGMPIVVIDSKMDTQASQECFEFLLKLKFSVSVGPCEFCIKASYQDTPLQFEKPNNCEIVGNNKLLKAEFSSTPPSPDVLSLANNQAGTTFAVFADEEGVKAQLIAAGIPGPIETLDSGPGAMQPDAAFYRADAAVAVWSQSSLSQMAYEALVNGDFECDEADLLADPGCDDQQNFDATQHQHLVYAVWDGDTWSPRQTLTAPNTGEGGVRLAACSEAQVTCPPGGEVLAVWHRDLAGDIDDHQVKLYYSYFDGVAWTAPQAIDPGSNAKDVQPAPLYLNGDPVVLWVRNPAPLTSGQVATGNRRFAYEFLRSGAGPQLAQSLPLGVASPSAVASGSGIVVAFTRASGADPFIGTRRSLYSATGTNCNNGICNWQSQQQKDQHGRNIYVEEPRVVLGSNNAPLAIYRWLSTGGTVMPGDPIGTAGLGDTAMHVLKLPQSVGAPEANVNPFTIDGLVNWQTAAVFDPSLNSIIALSGQAQAQSAAAGAQKLGFTATPLGGVTARKLAASTRPLTEFQTISQPDIAILSVEAPGVTVVQGDDVLDLEVRLANLGVPLSRGQSVSLEGWWNGPPGVGQFLGDTSVLAFDDPTETVALLSVDVPASVSDDDIHYLYVVAELEGGRETDGQNNEFVARFNALPVPANVAPMIDRAGTTAFLSWDDPRDERVEQYRVYRRVNGTDDVFQVGISPRLGFADVMSVPGEVYDYCVTSLSGRMRESACSDWLTVDVRAIPGDLIFADGF